MHVQMNSVIRHQGMERVGHNKAPVQHYFCLNHYFMHIS